MFEHRLFPEATPVHVAEDSAYLRSHFRDLPMIIWFDRFSNPAASKSTWASRFSFGTRVITYSAPFSRSLSSSSCKRLRATLVRRILGSTTTEHTQPRSPSQVPTALPTMTPPESAIRDSAGLVRHLTTLLEVQPGGGARWHCCHKYQTCSQSSLRHSLISTFVL